MTLFSLFISTVIETPMVSKYISGNLGLLLDLLTVRFRKNKLLPSWFLTVAAGDVS